MAKHESRRGRGEGALFYREDRDRWIGRVTVDGQQRTVSAPTKTEARRKLDVLRRAADDGTPVTAGHLTVANLLDDWLAKGLPNRNLEPSSAQRHRESAKALKEDIGTLRVRDLTPDAIETAFERRAKAGAARATLVKLRTTLSLALKWAERRGTVGRNVAAVVELPSGARGTRQGKAMTHAEARSFLDAAEGTPLGAMWITMLLLGLRPGEAAGLSWDDVDMTRGVIHIRRARKVDERGAAVIGTTKTAQSVRSLDAPPAVITALRAHRKTQNKARLAAGELWRNSEDLVFTSATGYPTDPARCRAEFNSVITAAKLGSGWTPNLLRHSAASLMADAGVPIEEVADQLGHRDTRMASIHYRHRIKPTVAGGSVLGKVLAAE